MQANRHKAKKAVFFAAIIAGAVASMFYALFLISEGVAYFIEGKFGAAPLVIMMLAAVAGYGLVLLKRNSGAMLMCIAALLMAAYLLIAGGLQGYKMALIFCLPFLVPGIILLKSKQPRAETE